MRADAWADAGPLTRECRVFTRYLVGREPDDYVIRKYLDGQGVVTSGARSVPAIDEALVRFASAGPRRARIADAYARVLRPRGVLRRKLIFAFAVLESSGGFHRDFTSGHGGWSWLAWWTLAWAAVRYLTALGVGLVVFGPRHLLASWLRWGSAG